MRYYVSKCHDRLNGAPYTPELVTPRLCLNPYYPVTLDPAVRVDYVLDSGAFQDVAQERRLTFADALERQLRFEARVGVRAGAVVSYDRLVDEQVGDGGQFKKRVDRAVGAEYVEETVKAAEYLSSRRGTLGGRRLILSCQGADVEQYLGCLESVLRVARPGDVVGIGGFCILSRRKEYEKEFYDVIARAFPMIRAAGLDRVHIFGVGVFRALVQADVYARMNGLECSYDTSSPEMNSVFGSSFNPVDGQMQKVYSKVHKHAGYEPADLALFNVRMMCDYWDAFGDLPLPDVFVPGVVR